MEKQMKRKTLVHKTDQWARRYGDGSGEKGWLEPHPPDPSKGGMYTAEPFHTCEFCGSMHPSDMVMAIKGGARIDPADRKYGWPHKFYVDNAPNPYEGQPEVRGATSVGGVTTYHDPQPAGKAYGKFYTVHLQDATEEEREIIEQALRIHFEFAGGAVKWWPYGEPQPEVD